MATDMMNLVVGAGMGMVVGYAVAPAPKERALYATSDSAEATRVEGLLDTAGIQFITTAPVLDPNASELIWYVILVSQANFDNALALISP